MLCDFRAAGRERGAVAAKKFVNLQQILIKRKMQNGVIGARCVYWVPIFHTLAGTAKNGRI